MEIGKLPVGSGRGGISVAAEAGGRVSAHGKVVPVHHAGVVAQPAGQLQRPEGLFQHPEAADIEQAVGRNREVGGVDVLVVLAHAVDAHRQLVAIEILEQVAGLVVKGRQAQIEAGLAGVGGVVELLAVVLLKAQQQAQLAGAGP